MNEHVRKTEGPGVEPKQRDDGLSSVPRTHNVAEQNCRVALSFDPHTITHLSGVQEMERKIISVSIGHMWINAHTRCTQGLYWGSEL